jgi:ClpP class serine protease
MSACRRRLGIKTTIVKAGKYKVERNPFGPLSEAAQAEMQAKVDEYYGMFLQAVADGRGTDVATVRDTFGQGRMVMPSKALTVGMVDEIATFDESWRGSPPTPTRPLLAAATEPEPAAATTPEHHRAGAFRGHHSSRSAAARRAPHQPKGEALMASVTELEARQAEIRSRIQEIDAEHAGSTARARARSRASSRAASSSPGARPTSGRSGSRSRAGR